MRTAAVFGTTGLIGKQLVTLLSENKNYKNIYSFSRKRPENLLVNVQHIDFNADAYSIPSGIDDLFICLGTTMKKARTQEAFKQVDLDMVINVAKKSLEAGCKKVVVVSSIGANPTSKNFYLRVKGTMEEEIKKLNFEYIGIVRPSMLLGKREEFRFAERVGITVFRIFSFIFVGPLRKYRGIDSADVAKSMIMLALNGSGKVTVESNILKQIADGYDQ